MTFGGVEEIEPDSGRVTFGGTEEIGPDTETDFPRSGRADRPTRFERVERPTSGAGRLPPPKSASAASSESSSGLSTPSTSTSEMIDKIATVLNIAGKYAGQKGEEFDSDGWLENQLGIKGYRARRIRSRAT